MSTPLAPSPAPAFDARARLNLNPAHWGVQALAEIGVAIALAAVLGQVRLFVMPQGGSVSLELLPIIFIAVRRGVVPGGDGRPAVRPAAARAARAPSSIHPAQAALDYPLAFMSLAVAGFVDVRGWRTLALAVVLALAARFAFHFLSGLIFFASYAPEWEAPWLYAATYNLLYLVPEGVLTTLLLWPLLKAYDAAFPGVAARRGRERAAGGARTARCRTTSPRRRLPRRRVRGARVLLRLGARRRPRGRRRRRRRLPARARGPPRPGGRRLRLAAAPPLSERLEAAGVELVRHPVRKDHTDGELAVDEARRRGAGELVLAGALGALDHTLGHLAVLRRLEAAGVAAAWSAPRLTARVLAAPAEACLDAPARHARLARAAGGRRARHPGGPRLPAQRAACCRRTRAWGWATPWSPAPRAILVHEGVGGGSRRDAGRDLRRPLPRPGRGAADAGTARLAAWRPSSWALVIVVFGVLPTHEARARHGRGREDDSVTAAGHFVEYAVLAFVLAVAFDGWRLSRRAVAGARRRSPSRLGVVIELVQLPLPYRDFQVERRLVDMAGAAAGLVAVQCRGAGRRARRPRWRRG